MAKIARSDLKKVARIATIAKILRSLKVQNC